MFPFSAIVGQPLLKRALLVCAVDSRIGGLLITGDKGTAKSTTVRSFARLLPTINIASECRFNCEFPNGAELCLDCSGKQTLTAATIPTPLVELPIGASEDRIIGSLDFEKALQTGTRQFQTGLLAKAHRGFIYIDEVNLLPDHLIDVLLDVSASGINVVERESMTLRHPAHFVLIGSMNPEEGELRPQFLDRFAMKVDVVASRDPLERVEIVDRRFAFENDQQSFCASWETAEKAIAHEITESRERLRHVATSYDTRRAIGALCADLGIKSLRADIYLNRVARALAALDAEAEVQDSHVREAAQLVLPHRLEHSGSSMPNAPKLEDALDKHFDGAKQAEGDSSEESNEDDQNPEPQNFCVQAPSSPSAIAKIELAESRAQFNGRRNFADFATTGGGARASRESIGRISVAETIVHSVTRTAGRLEVSPEDIRRRDFAGKSGNLIILAVDASGSLAAMERMRLVKGTALALLTDAYQRRDKICVVTFAGDSAELLLPPTRSSMQATQFLSELPTGGTTPLSAGLLKTLEVAEASERKGMQPLVVLFTDGRANKALSSNADPWQEALMAAGKLSAKNIPCLVVDCESGPVRLERAALIADRLEAQCIKIEALSAGELKKIVIQVSGAKSP